MKSKILGLLAVALAAVSVPAFAVGPGPLGNIDNLPISISNIVPLGIFQDVYSFSLVDPGDLTGNAVAINFGVYNISGLTVTLQDSSFAVIGSDATPDNGFTFSGLSSGSYLLNILGFATGSQGGFYSGGFVVTTVPVSPVPESGTLALLGLGLAGLGLARRRKAN